MPLDFLQFDCPRIVFSIIGEHAGEDLDTIFNRKQRDIDQCGRTHWMVSIHPDIACKINELVREGETYVFFLHAQSGNARPATSETKAQGYVDLYGIKHSFTDQQSAVTGRINSHAYAFELTEIISCAYEPKHGVVCVRTNGYLATLGFGCL